MDAISSCDEDRLRFAEEVSKSFDLAKKLMAQGKFKKALESYLFAFDNGKCVPGWGGVRLSFVPSAIARLGAHYPPALEALRSRRDAREELVRNGETDFDIVAEWISINRYLGDGDRMLAMLNELTEEMQETIIDETFEELVSRQQYKLAARVLGKRGRMFFMWECEYETSKFFPRRILNSVEKTDEMIELNRQVVRSSGLQVFEVSLGVKQKTQAQEIARRVLLHCADADTYIDLIEAAKRAGSKSAIKQLLKKAKSELAAEEFARVHETATASPAD